MGTPCRQDLHVRQGATFQQTLTWKVNGAAVNVTGFTARMDVRRGIREVLEAQITTENGKIVLGGALGTIQLNFSPTELIEPLYAFLYNELVDEQSQGIGVGSMRKPPISRMLKLFYDIELTSPAGAVERPFEGPLYLHREITE